MKYCGKGNFTDKKGNGEEPFKINKVVKNDSLFISFCFISDGCQNFVKETKITKDTLFLDYKTNSNTICEIYSEYYYEFIIPKCNWNVIYLKTKKI